MDKHIEKFSIEWMTSLDRPLIFRDLLSFFGQDWDLEGFQKMKQYYKEESAIVSQNLWNMLKF